MLVIEKWKIFLFNNKKTNYEVSDLGKVRHLEDLRIIPQFEINSGYLKLSLWIEGESIQILAHRLVLETFSEFFDPKKEVNHKNGKRKDNRLINLEQVSRSENIKHSYEILGHSKAQKVFQYNLKGEFIQSFYSEGEAARVTGAAQSQISRAVRGIALTAGGFQWRDILLERVEGCSVKTKKKTVLKKDCSGQILSKYSSIREASKENNIHSSSISKCCSGSRKTAGGFIWSFELVEDIV